MPGRRTSQTHDPRSPLDKERLSLTSQRFLSPLDTDPSYRLPRESAPSCGEPWGRRPHAAASRRGASRPDASRKGAVCGSHVAQNALFRHVAAPGRCGATARQAAGHYGKWLNWANALEQPPARLRGGLRQGPQISVRSPASRKGVLCPDRLTEKHILPDRRASECAFPSRRDRRVRFLVRVPAQNALFRKMRLSSPGQTWRHLTEKRTLSPAPHGKAHSGLIDSRKSAFCSLRLTEKRTLA